jgi:hypothetical protein
MGVEVTSREYIVLVINIEVNERPPRPLDGISAA